MSVVAGRRIKRMQGTKEEGARHKAVRVEQGAPSELAEPTLLAKAETFA